MKPGYKQTEVGMIPEEWEVKPLRSILAKGRLGGNYPNQDTESAFPLMKMGNIARGFFDMSKVEFITPGVTPENQHRLVHGDVLFNTRNTLELVGKVGIWRDELPLAFYNSNLMRLEFDPNEVSSNEYANYALNTAGAVARLRALATGTTSVAAIYTRDLLGLLFVVPPKAEQRAIAEALSDVDGLLGGLDRLIAKKRDLKQAAMQQLLTGQTRLPGFHGKWQDAQVQDVIAGFFCGPSPTCEERNIQDDNEWGVLKTTAATKENGWDWTKHKTLPRVFWNKPQIELKRGDVIVTKAGPRHRVGVTAWIDYVPPRIIPSGKMIALRPRPDKVVPLMLAAAISARDAQTYLDQRTTGMAESQVNFENIALLEAPITIPHIEEQTAIAEVLTDMDQELAGLEQRREKTRALKQAMMQELLTGRTRLV